MAQYVSVRFYKLTAEADPEAFEDAFHAFTPALGVERVMLPVSYTHLTLPTILRV